MKAIEFGITYVDKELNFKTISELIDHLDYIWPFYNLEIRDLKDSLDLIDSEMSNCKDSRKLAELNLYKIVELRDLEKFEKIIKLIDIDQERLKTFLNN